VTLPTMLYLESADDGGREVVRRVIEGEDRTNARVEEAIRLITASGALRQAQAEAQRFIDEAKAALAPMPDLPPRRSLLDLADFVVQRDF
jgi:heptaprenyl diphosphate synthase